MNPKLDPRNDIRFFYLMVYLSIGSPFTDLWYATEYDANNNKIPAESSNGYNISFEYRRDIFLWVLERLLKEGRIKLHKNGVFLEGSIEEQIEMFKKGFPKNEQDAHWQVFNTNEPQAKLSTAMGLWFFMDSCPAGVAWRDDKGQYIIAD